MTPERLNEIVIEAFEQCHKRLNAPDTLAGFINAHREDVLRIVRDRMGSEGSPQASISQPVTIQIDGAGDPRMVAMEVDRRLREHSERAANDFRSNTV